MKKFKGIKIPLAICFACFFFNSTQQALAQGSGTERPNPLTPPAVQMAPEPGRKTTLQQVYFEKEPPIGSELLSKTWMKGSMLMENNRWLPTPHQPLFFNYDKIKVLIYVIDTVGHMWVFPIDSVKEFTFSGDKLYTFKRVLAIANDFYLIPVIESDKGYSLYKRLYTKLYSADYANGGYFSRGSRSDEFAEYYQYYLLNPGNKSFRTFFLRQGPVNRAFKSEKELVQKYNSINEQDLNEEYLLGLVQYINEKKYPD